VLKRALLYSLWKKPDLIVGFGSYHSFPLLFAAKLKKIPFILFEADTIPGKVNRLFLVQPFSQPFISRILAIISKETLFPLSCQAGIAAHLMH